MDSSIVTSYRFNLSMAGLLVKGIDDSRSCEQPGRVPNHPVWVLGHLIYADNLASMLLGVTPSTPESYQELFGTGSVPVGDTSRYPTMSALLKAFQEAGERTIALYEKADDAALDQPLQVEGLNKSFPMNRDAVTFVMTAHASYHLGQMSSWRRAAGLGPAMA